MARVAENQEENTKQIAAIAAICQLDIGIDMKKILLVAVLLLTSSAIMHGQLKREYSKTSTASPVFSTTASPDIPSSVTFAGEKVSFDRLDMAERLDRELTGVIYGQTTTELCFKRANRYFPVLAKILKEQA